MAWHQGDICMFSMKTAKLGNWISARPTVLSSFITFNSVLVIFIYMI